MENFERYGQWFLPEDPENSLYGRLSYSLGQTTQLSLLGSFQSKEITPQSILGGEKIDIINGYFRSGKEVTLYVCHKQGGLSSGLDKTDVTVRCVIEGHHFKSIEELKLKWISARYRYLEEWMRLSSLQIQWETKPSRPDTEELIVKQIPHVPSKFGTLNQLAVSVIDSPISTQQLQMMKFFGNVPHSVKLEDHKRVILTSDVEVSLDTFISNLYILQDFLVLGMGQKTYMFDIRSSILGKVKSVKVPDELHAAIDSGLLEPEKVTEDDATGMRISTFGDEFKAVEVEEEKVITLKIYLRVEVNESQSSDFDAKKVLFYFPDVKNDISEVIHRWQVQHQHLRPILEKYLGLIYLPERYTNDYFLTLAQSVEAFHRITYRESRFDSELVDLVISKMIDAIPSQLIDTQLENSDQSTIEQLPGLAESIKNRIAFSHEYSLKERLEELMSENADSFPQGFLNDNDQSTNFARCVRDTRGSLTHLSSKKTDREKTSKYALKNEHEISWLSLQLKKLLEICLLRDLGISVGDVRKIMKRR